MTRVANFDYKYDYSPVVLWQYGGAKNIKKIVENEQQFLDMAITQFRNEFDEKIFNLKTCDSNGLDLWGRMLGIMRPSVNDEIFSDEQYRLLLLSRFSLLTWNGSSYDTTRVIKNLFPEAIFKVEDNGDMTVDISFAGGITEEQRVVLSMGYIDETSGEYVYTFLPRPAGVIYNIAFDDTWATTLGFEGMTETTNMGGAYDCDPDDHTGETGTENADGGVFYK
jgi:hypothetical protein